MTLVMELQFLVAEEGDVLEEECDRVGGPGCCYRLWHYAFMWLG